MDALRQALHALHAGRFADAAALSAPWSVQADVDGSLLHGLALGGAGRVEESAALLARVARRRPGHPHPVQDLLGLPGMAAQREAHLRAALRHMPDSVWLLAALGAVLAEQGPMEEAIAHFRRVAALGPGDAAAWSNLGKALAAEGRFAEAEAAFTQSHALAPRDAQLGLNRAVALLKAGDWGRGWPAFRIRHALPSRRPPLPGPRLDVPESLAGRTVLLSHDEGFGDTLQFIRYAALLADRGATVVVHVPPPLQRLLRTVPGVSNVVGGPALPPYDAWCAIPDLPGIFATTPGTVPASTPYLRADPAEAARWAACLPPGRRVGLVWAGAARAHDPAAAATDRLRSTTPEVLAPLLAVPGLVPVSLQWGVPAPPGMVDAMAEVQDFADTAAIVAGLDTVVSVDTAVAHLAAGMGKPVVLLDRYDNCWRWLSGRTGSPWYPTLRIVRQRRPGDWAGVAADAAALMR